MENVASLLNSRVIAKACQKTFFLHYYIKLFDPINLIKTSEQNQM